MYSSEYKIIRESFETKSTHADINKCNQHVMLQNIFQNTLAVLPDDYSILVTH